MEGYCNDGLPTGAKGSLRASTDVVLGYPGAHNEGAQNKASIALETYPPRRFRGVL